MSNRSIDPTVNYLLDKIEGKVETVWDRQAEQIAGASPEWMSEKAIAIGQYFVASGVYTIFGVGLPIHGSEKFSKLMFEKFKEIFGAMWGVEKDSGKMAGMIIDHINKK